MSVLTYARAHTLTTLPGATSSMSGLNLSTNRLASSKIAIGAVAVSGCVLFLGYFHLLSQLSVGQQLRRGGGCRSGCLLHPCRMTISLASNLLLAFLGRKAPPPPPPSPPFFKDENVTMLAIAICWLLPAVLYKVETIAKAAETVLLTQYDVCCAWVSPRASGTSSY